MAEPEYEKEDLPRARFYEHKREYGVNPALYLARKPSGDYYNGKQLEILQHWVYAHDWYRHDVSVNYWIHNNNRGKNPDGLVFELVVHHQANAIVAKFLREVGYLVQYRVYHWVLMGKTKCYAPGTYRKSHGRIEAVAGAPRPLSLLQTVKLLGLTDV